MSIYTKVNGEQKEIADCKVKVGGVWRQASSVYAKANGVWKKVRQLIDKVFTLYNGQSTTIRVRGFSEKSTSSTLKGVKIRLIEQSSGTVYAQQDIGDCVLTHGDTSPKALTVSYQSNYNCAFYLYLNDTTYPYVRVDCSLYPGNTASFFIGGFEYTDCVAN